MSLERSTVYAATALTNFGGAASGGTAEACGYGRPGALLRPPAPRGPQAMWRGRLGGVRLRTQERCGEWSAVEDDDAELLFAG